jgi:hypothetical protein
VQKAEVKAALCAVEDREAMADHSFHQVEGEKVLDRKWYMCIIVHIHYEAK